MKTLATIITCTLCACTAFSQESWQLISQPGTNTLIADELVSYSYRNESVGSHGYRYKIYRSNDGGHNYTLIKSKTGDFGCYLVDELHVMDADNIYFAESCQGISALIRSPDGGGTWENLGYGGATSISMFFLREDYGYYTFYPGAPNDSYFMQNGSAVFVTSKYVFANGYPVPGQTTEIYFKNDSTGLVMCRDSIGNNVVIATEDYGLSWEEKLSFGGESLNDMYFVNDSVGFVAGSGGKLFRTDNFGDSWVNQLIPEGINLNSIDFAPDGVGYIAGDQGILLKSTDGGISWTEMISPGPDRFIYIRAFEEDLLNTIDEYGNLYASTGGASISDIGQDAVKIFPNPAASEVNIRLPDNIRLLGSSIFDMQGRKLKVSNDKTISLGALASGFYMLEVRTSHGVFRKKFYKK
jgi:photosystem II stability/assembly factor-like uncharacterized protein